VFSENVSDAESREAGATVVTEERIFGQRAVAPFGQQRTKNLGCLRPQRANTFLAALAKQANVRRGFQAHIKHAHRDDFLDPCACIEHRREERVITTAISGRPVNCGQHRLNLCRLETLQPLRNDRPL
jgi:hypothetical protein